MTKEGLTKNCKFHDPRGRGSCARVCPYKSNRENTLFLLKSSIPPCIDQTNGLYSNDAQGKVYHNCKFHDTGAGVLMLGRGHISHYSDYVLYSTLSIYSTLIAIVLRDYDAAFRYHR